MRGRFACRVAARDMAASWRAKISSRRERSWTSVSPPDQVYCLPLIARSLKSASPSVPAWSKTFCSIATARSNRPG